MTAPVRPMLRMLAAAGALLLLIACANLVTLFLERSDSRRAELEVRRALGATRRQLLRQFVVDGAVLSAAGGAAGAALAYWMVQLVVLIVPSDVPRASEITVTAPVLAAAIAAAVVLGVVLSVGSARGARHADRPRRWSSRRSRLRSCCVSEPGCSCAASSAW